VSKDPNGVRQTIGNMSQAFSLYRELTIGENLRFYSDVYGNVTDERVRDVAQIVGLDDTDLRLTVAELATGIRQRAALAAAVLHQPELLFLDEPTSGVDPTGRRDFWLLLRGLAASGTTVVASTHVMPEAERCDRVALMVEGKVISCASPADLKRSMGSVIALVDAEPWQQAYAQVKARWPYTTLRGQIIRVPVPARCDATQLLSPSLAGVDIRRIDVVQPNFEDAFGWYVRGLPA
jgi:ABC-2 type transport system ATP-binding protein